MGLYAKRILPRLLDLSMGHRELQPYRRRIIQAAEGRVLEIGIGSGRNLPLYDDRVTEIVGVDPSPELLRMARRAAGRGGQSVSFVEAPAEAIPLDDRSFDCAVVTWSLCTIPDPLAALAEVRRLLVPGGGLLFAEHGLSPDPGVRRWQDRLTPVWKVCAGGCHLNRAIDELLRQAGFEIVAMETGYARGLKPMTWMFEGRAVPR